MAKWWILAITVFPLLKICGIIDWNWSVVFLTMYPFIIFGVLRIEYLDDKLEELTKTKDITDILATKKVLSQAIEEVKDKTI
jgi:hypothetical protein